MSDYDEQELKPKRYQQCRDRMCGAGDCPLCNPSNFFGGVYIGDIEEEEALRDSREKALEEKP
jgi:hypothetical protein